MWSNIHTHFERIIKRSHTIFLWKKGGQKKRKNVKEQIDCLESAKCHIGSTPDPKPPNFSRWFSVSLLGRDISEFQMSDWLLSPLPSQERSFGQPPRKHLSLSPASFRGTNSSNFSHNNCKTKSWSVWSWCQLLETRWRGLFVPVSGKLKVLRRLLQPRTKTVSLL